jgi:hypothetical protein
MDSITEKCKVTVFCAEDKKETVIVFDTEKRPWQAEYVGKKIGDLFYNKDGTKTYRVLKIEEVPPPPPPPPPIGKLKPPFPAPPPPLTPDGVERRYGINLSGKPRGVYKKGDILLLVSVIPSNREFVYHDGWDENGDFIFSGTGLYGDQELKGINYCLAYGKQRCYLLFRQGHYYYDQGEVIRVGFREEKLSDANGEVRKEFRFRFRLVSKIGK